jgi:cytochrome c2
MLKVGRVIVPNFQFRILLGISSYVGIVLLVLWIAINEPARMESFKQQFLGRSIENGAVLYRSFCASCHGEDGKGQTGIAPALNNPMLFLKENPARTNWIKLEALKKQQHDLMKAIDTHTQAIAALALNRERLKKVLPNSTDAEALKLNIERLDKQIKAFDRTRTEKQIEDLALEIKQIEATISTFMSFEWDPFRDVRLQEVRWTGTLDDYIFSAIYSGRPNSSAIWPEPMSTWAQRFGGPLRADNALKLTPRDVNEQFRIGRLVEPEPPPAIGCGADLTELEFPSFAGGNIKRGQEIYNALGCRGCHETGAIAPITQGTWTRINNLRLKDPANAGKTTEQYLAESILRPNAYIVPGYQGSIMPQTYCDQFDIFDMRDLIAYLRTQVYP